MQVRINSQPAISPETSTRPATVARGIVLASVLMVSMLSVAHAGSGGSKGGGHRGPPQEAIDACTALTEGDACSFTGRNDESLSGVCFAPQDRDLACKPEGHDKPRGSGAGPDDSAEN